MMRLMKMKHQKEIQVLYFGSKSMCIFKGAVLNSRFKVVPAVYLIHICMNKILLSLRKNTGFYDGYYSLVAGHIEGNETMTQAMIREAYEEAGIELNSDCLQMKTVIHRKSDDRESVDFFFKSSEDMFSPINREPDKCSELGYFPLDALPENIIPYVKKGIFNSIQGINYDETGWNESLIR